MLNGKKKKEQKKMPIFPNFVILLITFRDPPQEYVCIFGSQFGVFFQRRCHLKVFTPIWSYVNENANKKKKKRKNGQNCKIWNHSALNNFRRDPP